MRAFPAVVYAAVSSINAWMLKALSWYPDANCSEMPQSAYGSSGLTILSWY